MKRVILLGTTTGTTWRFELTGRLIRRGVQPEQIINPHLPAGVKYTPAHMAAERAWKRDPDTLIFIYVCPAAPEVTEADLEAVKQKSEWLGPITMFEIGKFAYSEPHRTAVVLATELYTPGKRPRQVLEGLATELCEDYGGRPPYFVSQVVAEDWLVEQLVEA